MEPDPTGATQKMVELQAPLPAYAISHTDVNPEAEEQYAELCGEAAPKTIPGEEAIAYSTCVRVARHGGKHVDRLNRSW